MPNYLTTPKKSANSRPPGARVSYHRIEAETGVRRETVNRYGRRRRSNAAKTFRRVPVAGISESAVRSGGKLEHQGAMSWSWPVPSRNT